MATFSITVDVSPLATAIELYYTHIKPDGTTSSPSQKYTGVGIGGFIALPPTPHPIGYTYTINNVVLNNNTVYNFEVKQYCVDGTIEYSPIDGDHYRTNCVDLLLQIGGFNYQTGEYPIVTTWAPGGPGFDPNNYSIQDYTINIKYSTAVIGQQGGGGSVQTIDTITLPSVPATIPGSSYVYGIESSDLTYPLEFGNIYEISISYNIVFSTGNTIEVNCAPKTIQIPYLRTYKIHGAEGWVVDWIDENNIHQRSCGGPDNAPNGPTRPCEASWLLVHHRYNPTGGTSASNPFHPICGYCVTPGAIFPNPYNFMYVPNPTVYNSDRVNCYPVNAGSSPNPSVVPCNCGDNGSNNLLPGWGATWELIGDGYVSIPGILPPPACNITTVCTNAPIW